MITSLRLSPPTSISRGVKFEFFKFEDVAIEKLHFCSENRGCSQHSQSNDRRGAEPSTAIIIGSHSHASRGANNVFRLRRRGALRLAPLGRGERQQLS